MKFRNLAVCDLRGYNSVEAASAIESVQNAALVILPKTSDNETRAAFAKIEMHNVATTIYAETETQIHTYNGKATLSNANLPEGESIYIINGEARIFPVSPEKKVSLIVNGKAIYDKNSESLNFLNVNGKAIPIDFQNTEILSDSAVLHADKFTSDGENKYYAADLAVVPSVPQAAHGKVIAGTIIAHPNVAASGIVLESEDILYAENDGRVLFKKDMVEIHLTPMLLESIPGKLVLMDIATVRIDKKVTADLLREKVLLIQAVATVRATKETFDIVQLLARDVATIRRR